MEKDLEFARGQFSGALSNCNYKEKWETISTALNALGGSAKSTEQWKKCWMDLKCAIKNFFNSRRKFMNQTGGGSWVDVPRDLIPLEEKILAIITVDAVDGDSRTPKSGVPVEVSVEEFLSVDVLEEEEIFCPPHKRLKSNVQRSPCSTSQAAQNRIASFRSSTNNSKYVDAIDEARRTQGELIKRIENLENQNKTILSKIKKF